MQKKYVAIILLFFFLISMISILGSPLAATYHRIPTNTSTTVTSDKIRFYVDDPSGAEPAGLALTYNNLHGLLSEHVFVIESDTEFKVYPGTRTDLVVFTGTRFVLDSDYLDSYYANEEPGTTVFNMHLFFVPVSGSSLTLKASYSVGLTVDELPKIIVSDETQHFQSEQANGFVELYLNETTPLTAEYLINNPTYRLNLSYTNILSLYLGGSLYKEQIGYSPSSISSEILQEDYEADPTNAKWKEPLTLRVYKTGYYTIFDVSLTEIVIDDPTDPTDPTNPDHGGSGTDIEEDDNSGLISGIVDGIGGFFEWIWEKISTFFSQLFKPITDFIAEWKERLEDEDTAKATFWSSLSGLWDKISGYTLDPIIEFADDILDVEAIALVMMFWDIPILKEATLAAIFILVIMAFIILIISI